MTPQSFHYLLLRRRNATNPWFIGLESDDISTIKAELEYLVGLGRDESNIKVMAMGSINGHTVTKADVDKALAMMNEAAKPAPEPSLFSNVSDNIEDSTLDIVALDAEYQRSGKAILQMFQTNQVDPETGINLLAYLIGLCRGLRQQPIAGTDYFHALSIGWTTGAESEPTDYQGRPN